MMVAEIDRRNPIQSDEFAVAQESAEHVSMVLFYDGACGLCHNAVKFVLARDRRAMYSFSPLGSPFFIERLTAEQQSSLPDSLVVLSDDGALWVRTRAVRKILHDMQGGWRVLAAFLWVVPTPLADVVYRGVAAIRHRLFKTPDDVCPVIPPELRSRFI